MDGALIRLMSEGLHHGEHGERQVFEDVRDSRRSRPYSVLSVELL